MKFIISLIQPILLFLVVYFTLNMFIGKNNKVEDKLPKFKIGDCIILNEDIEEWQKKDLYIKKIIAIGKQKYLFEYQNGLLKKAKTDEYFSLTDLDGVYLKTECPK